MNTLQRQAAFDNFKPEGTGFQTQTNLICFSYSFLVTFACLLNGFLTSITAAIILLAGLSSLVLFPKMLTSNPNLKILLVLPMLAVFSALWSQHPGTTFYYAIQLFPTILVAFTLGSFRRQDIAIKGIFYAHLIFAIASLAFGKSVMWENSEYVFVGLSGAKNAYGAVNFYVVVLGGYAIHKGLSSKDRLFALAGVVSIMAGAAGLVLSRASGSMVGAILGLLTYFILLRITRFRPTSRAGLLIVIFFFGSLAAFFLSFFWNELYSGFLRYLGKDPGLTGRVDLWDIADNIISRNFEVGVGQFAFWVQNDPLPEAIWSEMGILSRGGFNFHNSFREVLVHLGLLGLVVYASVIGYLGLKQLKTALFQPRAEKLFYVVIILGAIERMPVESFLPIAPVGLSTILFVSALILRPEKNTRPNGIPPRQVRDTAG